MAAILNFTMAATSYRHFNDCKYVLFWIPHTKKSRHSIKKAINALFWKGYIKKMRKMAAILNFKMAAIGVIKKNGTNSSLVP
jgi:Na+/H+ antiporter NhaC